MGSFSVAGYFFDLSHEFCIRFAVAQDNTIYTVSRERQCEDLVLRQYRFFVDCFVLPI